MFSLSLPNMIVNKFMFIQSSIKEEKKNKIEHQQLMFISC